MKKTMIKRIFLSVTVLLCMQNVQAGNSLSVLKHVGSAGVHTVRASFSGLKYLLTTKLGILGLTGLGCYGAGKFLWNRYWVFPKIRYALNPPVGEPGWQGGRKLYNWRISDPNYSCSAALLANQRNIKDIFEADCTVSFYDIYKSVDVQNAERTGNDNYENLRPADIGHMATFADLLATIRVEKHELKRWKDFLRSCVDLGIRFDWHPWGVTHDFQTIAAQLNVSGRDLESHINVASENAIHTRMQQKRFQWYDYLISCALLKPNYSAAYKLYWEVYRRYERLITLARIIEQASGAKTGKPVIGSDRQGGQRIDHHHHMHGR